MKKEKSDQNVVAELTREGLYKENKWLWEENRKLKEEVEVWKNANKKLRMHDAKMEYENRKLKAAATMYRNDCKKLRAENEYLHQLLPEADGYIIEKQMEKRLWNDGEEDVYEDWGE